MLHPSNISGFFASLRDMIKNDVRVPKEIREDMDGATELAVQSANGFFIIQYATKDGIPKKFQYYANGMSLQTSGV